jgi:hypothetical protein
LKYLWLYIVLMRKLEVVAPLPNVDSETVRKCKAAFTTPLPDHTLESLELLLGATFDPVAWNLDMTGLDEGDN